MIMWCRCNDSLITWPFLHRHIRSRKQAIRLLMGKPPQGHVHIILEAAALDMMTSSNGNIFRVTGHLCGEFTGHRWISQHKGQWCGALMFSLICAWINGWANNGEVADMRRHRAHYEVIVIMARVFHEAVFVSLTACPQGRMCIKRIGLDMGVHDYGSCWDCFTKEDCHGRWISDGCEWIWELLVWLHQGGLLWQMDYWWVCVDMGVAGLASVRGTAMADGLVMGVCEYGSCWYGFTNEDCHGRWTGGTGGNRAKLPSSRWRRRGRSLREVFACSRLFATIDLSQICNRVTRGHGTPCTKTTDAYPFSFLYNNLRKIRRETTVGEKPGRR